MTTPKEPGRTPPRGRFKPGQSGNPKGKPKGARNAVLVALDKVGAAEAEAVLKAAVEAAKKGDPRSCELILSRVWPLRRGRPVALDLPPLRSPADLTKAVAAVVAAVAAGQVTAEEGQAVAGLLDLHRRAVETADLDARLTALEKRRG